MEYEKYKATALLDGDELIYRVGYSSEQVWYYLCPSDDPVEEKDNHDNWTVKFQYKKHVDDWLIGREEDYRIVKAIEAAPIDEAILNMRTAIRTVMADTSAKDYNMYLSGPNNFRIAQATLTQYKERPEGKPVHYAALKDYLKDEWWAQTLDDCEADDGMSLTQWQAFVEDDINRTIICTQDKDLDMIPGWRYRTNKRELLYIPLEQADRNFFIQLLSGDPVDTIPGIRGIAAKTANSILGGAKSPADYYEIVLHQYVLALKNGKLYSKTHQLTTDKTAAQVVTEIGNLLWMRRVKDQTWRQYYGIDE